MTQRRRKRTQILGNVPIAAIADELAPILAGCGWDKIGRNVRTVHILSDPLEKLIQTDHQSPDCDLDGLDQEPDCLEEAGDER